MSTIPKVLRAGAGGTAAAEYAPTTASSERRVYPRYPTSAELKFALGRRGRVAVAGEGRSIDISSGGLLFESASPLPVGFPIDVVLAWPARFNNAQALELYISGRIVRSDGNRTAVAITRHEFRRKQTGTATPEADAIQVS